MTPPVTRTEIEDEDPEEIRSCPECPSKEFYLRWHLGDWLVECSSCGERYWLEDLKEPQK